MTLSRQNIVCGLIVISVGLLLYSQTLSPTTAASEGMQTMEYPRVLICLLILLGGGILVHPASGEACETTTIPLLSKRTCALGCALILYATLLDTLGFVVSSFCMACATGYIMGYRRLYVLVLCNLFGIAVIWSAFRFVLKIPLPAGYLL